tara:strand:+ start:488 stop:1024 length:537 start_codon:yes stop_codon:yes gene_type:complete
MAVQMEPELDAPIPGMSLTSELGARPWQSPPEGNDLNDAVDFYIPRLGDPEYVGQVLDIIDSGVPLTSIAESMILVGNMEGKHSIDVGVLVQPVIVEFLKGIADITETKYTMSADKNFRDKDVTEGMLNKVTKELQTLPQEQQSDIDNLVAKSSDIDTDIEEKDIMEEPKGLMARRAM